MRTFQRFNKKEPKAKTCKVCGNEFMPRTTTQVICSTLCAVKNAELKLIAKANRQARAEAKVWHENNDKISVFENKLQGHINAIARHIDYGQPCIATGSYEGKQNGGHYISVGSNKTIRYCLHNVHLQSEHSNTWKSGDTLRYQQGIIKRYGKDYLDFMDNLQSCQPIKLNRKEIFELITKAAKIRKSLENNLMVRTPQQRIQLRNEINLELGIYKNEYCEFKQ